MRKYLLLLLSLGIILGSFWSFPVKLGPTTKIVEPSQQPVTLILDFGGGAKRETKVSAATAFEALEVSAKQDNLGLKTKQYDFGIFVEGIGGVENSRQRAWIYFVNGKTAEVAADKYELKSGDLVEWKYIKPIY